MQDTAPRLIPSLIEMLNTGYDEICEVQLHNLHYIHVCWFQGCCLMHASLSALHFSYEWGQLKFCSRSPSGHLNMEFSFPSNQYVDFKLICNQELQAIHDYTFALSSKKYFPLTSLPTISIILSIKLCGTGHSRWTRFVAKLICYSEYVRDSPV